jgi:hypothetical protein
MTVFTEGRHAAEFILSEANGQRSRKNGVVSSGQNLVAGQLVQLSGTELVAKDENLETDGSVTTAVEGILLEPVNASSTGTNADTPAAYIARDAEVNVNLLTFPAESTAGGEQAACIAGLALLGIIAR